MATSEDFAGERLQGRILLGKGYMRGSCWGNPTFEDFAGKGCIRRSWSGKATSKDFAGEGLHRRILLQKSYIRRFCWGRVTLEGFCWGEAMLEDFAGEALY